MSAAEQFQLILDRYVKQEDCRASELDAVDLGQPNSSKQVAPGPCQICCNNCNISVVGPLEVILD
ncbi:MAG TPA: hypothetical protein V6D08_10170 [Candidatus Obscuribacterales bacterium]